jgi:hypothetical protein
MGPRGLVGPQGNIGPQGVVGPMGPAGANGADGADGADGAVGPAGPPAVTVATWVLDVDAAAIELADTSGLGNDLVATAGAVSPGSATAHSMLSVAFNGLEGLHVPPGNAIPDSAQIAPELWIRTGDPSQTYTLLEKNGAYRLRMTGGRLEFTVTTTGGVCTVTHTSDLAADTWLHVSGIYDGLMVATAVDGVVRSTACRLGRIAPTLGGVLAVGGRYDGAWSEVFRGNIDEVRLRVTPQWSVGRVTATCDAGEAVTGITMDGRVTCAPAGTQRVIRYNVVDTYLETSGWAAGNNPAMFGGVNPSSWTDGNALASHMSADAETLRTLFTRKVYPGKNALVSSERWVDQSSTNGKVTVALMRIKNSTGNAIDFTPRFYFTAYQGWSERASVALNGQNIWNTGSDYHWNNTAAVTLSIPANRTSTVIFVVPSSPPWSTRRYLFRVTMLAFYNDSLHLPEGLSFVDDLETVSGNLW